MSTTPIAQEVTKEEAEHDDHEKIFEKLIQTLAKGKGWGIQQHLYNYNGFWLRSFIIKNNLFLHTHFKPEPNDIVLASFPKSGTTWFKAIVFATLNRHRYNFSDHHLLHNTPHNSVPSIDFITYPDIIDFSSTTAHFSEPRLFATHFARTLLPPSMTASCKFVYVCRDPKDVLVSKWLFMTRPRPTDLDHPITLSLDEAFELFCKGVSHYGPFWEHVLSYWNASVESPDKILFLKYEEMKKQLGIDLRKLAAFMGKPFSAEEEENGVVEEIVKLCSFENLREVNKKGVEKFGKILEAESKDFFRKGEIGDWKNYLSEEMKQRIDRITNEKLKGSGLIFGARD